MENTWAISIDVILNQSHQTPHNQEKFCKLFSFLGIPCSWGKQFSGKAIDIIGHQVSCPSLCFLLPLSRKFNLVNTMKKFTLSPSHPLIEWSLLLGWASWSLNSFSLGLFALQSTWDKITGKKYSPCSHICLFRDFGVGWLCSQNLPCSSFPFIFFFGTTPKPIQYSLSTFVHLVFVFGNPHLIGPGLIFFPLLSAQVEKLSVR